jgi:hypothetical protein
VLTANEKAQIDRQYERESDWKKILIRSSCDAFCDWLKTVLPGIVTRLLGVLERVWQWLFS